MTRVSALVLGFSVALAACADSAGPTDPGPLAADAPAFSLHAHTVTMFDACDPVTFNAFEPGICLNRQGGVTFEKFIEQLTRHQTIGSWFFSPRVIRVAAGTTVPAHNRGGETHTFTPVAEFGGGFIPILNTLTGNPVPAPECIDLVQNGPFSEFVPAGGSIDRTIPAGETKWMCCLHPWMRAVSHGQ